ncbi:hypothetical protein KPH14_003825 [Odynerus spinipes]|uniref:Uncharacterized protein n=1 Tax=Odynerus spinipes TaxID=1348599 RepID=A0AAD9RXE1_9HYME|nr:hypothetical protein KPH14_003825 [Odynerus spinipes]
MSRLNVGFILLLLLGAMFFQSTESFFFEFFDQARRFKCEHLCMDIQTWSYIRNALCLKLCPEMFILTTTSASQTTANESTMSTTPTNVTGTPTTTSSTSTTVSTTTMGNATTTTTSTAPPMPMMPAMPAMQPMPAMPPMMAPSNMSNPASNMSMVPAPAGGK